MSTSNPTHCKICGAPALCANLRCAALVMAALGRRRVVKPPTVLEQAKRRQRAEKRAAATLLRLMASPQLAELVEAAKASGELVEAVERPGTWYMGKSEDTDPVALFVRVRSGVIVDEAGKAYVEPWARPEPSVTDQVRRRRR